MNQLSSVPSGAVATAIYFAECLGKIRALTSNESEMLEHAIRRSVRISRRWTKEEDSMLLAFKRAEMTDEEIARSMGRTYHATKSRLRDLRKGRA